MPAVYTCKRCSFVTSSNVSMKSHITRKFICVVSEEGTDVSQASMLREHREQVMISEKRVQDANMERVAENARLADVARLKILAETEELKRLAEMDRNNNIEGMMRTTLAEASRMKPQENVEIKLIETILEMFKIANNSSHN